MMTMDITKISHQRFLVNVQYLEWCHIFSSKKLYFHCNVPGRWTATGVIDTQRIHIQQIPENKHMHYLCTQNE